MTSYATVPSFSIDSSSATFASSPAVPSQLVQLSLQTHLAAVQSCPAPAVGAFVDNLVAPYSCMLRFIPTVCATPEVFVPSSVVCSDTLSTVLSFLDVKPGTLFLVAQPLAEDAFPSYKISSNPDSSKVYVAVENWRLSLHSANVFYVPRPPLALSFDRSASPCVRILSPGSFASAATLGLTFSGGHPSSDIGSFPASLSPLASRSCQTDRCLSMLPKRPALGPVSRKPRKHFGPVKPVLFHQYRRTEKCMRLHLLV